jgi:hypothetical protein
VPGAPARARENTGIEVVDLEALGGSDRAEAAGRLREWLLTHP